MIKKLFTTFKSYQLNHFNMRLVIYVVALTCIGILAIGSASDEDYQAKQMLGMAAGIVIMLILALVSYKWILKFYWIIYFVNIVLLLIVVFYGSIHSGAERWIDIGPFQFQPSEFTKIFMLLFTAMYIQKFGKDLNTLRVLGGYIVLAAIPLALILQQPDLSTTIVIFTTLCVVLFLSGLSYKIIFGVLAVAIPVAAVFVYMVSQPDQTILENYQLERIMAFYSEDGDEEILYQQTNSIIAIGSGGLTGKGLDNNTVTSVKNGNFLSEPHTDFIFTIIGEELGFVGCIAVLLLIALIVFECFWAGFHSSDEGGRTFAYGFGTLICLQSFINIAVATMLIPNTGLTLPFVSYGLSSLLSLYTGVGIVLNIGMQRKRSVYEEYALK